MFGSCTRLGDSTQFFHIWKKGAWAPNLSPGLYRLPLESTHAGLAVMLAAPCGGIAQAVPGVPYLSGPLRAMRVSKSQLSWVLPVTRRTFACLVDSMLLSVLVSEWGAWPPVAGRGNWHAGLGRGGGRTRPLAVSLFDVDRIRQSKAGPSSVLLHRPRQEYVLVGVVMCFA